MRSKISGKIGTVTVGDGNPVRIMGVLNLTENSFYSGSVAKKDSEIKRIALSIEEEGADLIDIGARSTAPYRKYDVPEESEKRLLVKAIRILSKSVDIPISVDTTRYEPARAAIAEGATILNDVYGLTEEGAKLASLVASKDFSLLTCAHEKTAGEKSDPMARVIDSLKHAFEIAEVNGVDMDKITIDPGIGFFQDRRMSNAEWNCSVINNLEKLRELERPICVGLSRKTFIGQILETELPAERLYGSLGATAVAVYKGAHLIRTHDVKETLEAVRIAHFLREKKFNPPQPERNLDAENRGAERGAGEEGRRAPRVAGNKNRGSGN